MSAMISRMIPRPLLFLPVAALGCLALGSCGLSKKKAAENTAYTDGSYATYPSDGHYNPYPGSGSHASQASTPRYEEYTEEPPPPPSRPKTTKPSGAGSTAKTAARKPSGAAGGSYVVKRGDTLYAIARRNHTTVSKLKSANGLTSDLIRDGQKLKIP